MESPTKSKLVSRYINSQTSLKQIFHYKRKKFPLLFTYMSILISQD